MEIRAQDYPAVTKSGPVTPPTLKSSRFADFVAEIDAQKEKEIAARSAVDVDQNRQRYVYYENTQLAEDKQ